MCLAIYKPAGEKVPLPWLKEAFRFNDDGAGFAYVENSQLHVDRGYFTFDSFYRAYEPHAQKQAIIHFRKCTHGGKSVMNCHPFQFNGKAGKMAMIHNGVIDIKIPKPDHSDTRTFAALVLEPIAMEIDLETPAIKYLIEGSIGRGNKIVTLCEDGRAIIFNEDAGHWKDKMWFSNCSYVPTSYIGTGAETGEFYHGGVAAGDVGCGTGYAYDSDSGEYRNGRWYKKKRAVVPVTVHGAPAAKLTKKQIKKLARAIARDGLDAAKCGYAGEVADSIEQFIKENLEKGRLIVRNGHIASPGAVEPQDKAPEPVADNSDGPDEPPPVITAPYTGTQPALLPPVPGNKLSGAEMREYGEQDYRMERDIAQTMRMFHCDRREAITRLLNQP